MQNVESNSVFAAVCETVGLTAENSLLVDQLDEADMKSIFRSLLVTKGSPQTVANTIPQHATRWQQFSFPLVASARTHLTHAHAYAMDMVCC